MKRPAATKAKRKRELPKTVLQADGFLNPEGAAELHKIMANATVKDKRKRVRKKPVDAMRRYHALDAALRKYALKPYVDARGGNQRLRPPPNASPPPHWVRVLLIVAFVAVFVCGLMAAWTPVWLR